MSHRPILRDDLDRRVVGMAIPALGALAVEPAYVLVDTAIVGRIGTDALAGLAIAATILLTVVSMCNFLAYGTNQRVAHHRGARRPEDAAATAVQAMWLAVLIGAPLLVATAVLAEPLCRALGGHDAGLDAATTYLRISALGLPFILIALAGQGVLRGFADLRTPLVIVAVANAVNVVLEIIAVYVLGLGIAGSAWSTVVVQVAAAAWYLAVLRRHMAPARTRRPDPAELRPMMSAGKHLVVRIVAMLVVFVGTTAVASRIDTPTLAAHQIALQAFSLLALVLDAFAIPAQTLVAEALGHHDVALAERTSASVVRLSFRTGVVLGVAVALLSPVIPHLFTADAAVASRATAALALLGVILVPGAIAFAYDGVLIGAADYAFLGRAAIGYLVAYVPMAALTLAVPSLGIVGVWLGFLVWMMARAGFNARRYSTRRWATAT